MLTSWAATFVKLSKIPGESRNFCLFSSVPEVNIAGKAISKTAAIATTILVILNALVIICLLC